MSRVAGQGGGIVGGGAGGGRGGGWGRGGGGRSNGGHGGDDDDARRALVRSVGAKKRAARKWLKWGMHPPPSLREYAPGGRYYDHLPPVVHAPAPVVHAPPPPPARAPPPGHVYAHDDTEEAAFIAQAITQSEAAIAEMLCRDNEEIAAAMAVFQAREAAERAAKRARVEESIVLDDDE